MPPPAVASPEATLAATAAWVKYCSVAITPVTAANSDHRARSLGSVT